MPRKRKGNPVHGWVVFDKPLGMTSTQGVGKVRWLFQAQKAGHAGTLDPLASGILPIALGDATKTVPFSMDADKDYLFTVTWGENTDSRDAEGTVTETSDIRPSAAEIEDILPDFTGHIEQAPPRFSAIKVDGKRSYDLARAGEVVELKSRPVHVKSLRLTESDETSATFALTCGKGTYVRSLARDMAKRLGTCGHVTFLRRTRVGRFTLDTSFSLDALEKLCHRGGVSDGLLPIETALDDIPVLAATSQDAEDLKHGRAIAAPSHFHGPDNTEQPQWVLVKNEDRAIALCNVQGDRLLPKRVFNL